jgi:hypothetical protein
LAIANEAITNLGAEKPDCDYHPNRQAVEPGQSTTTVASIPQSASNASPSAPEQQRGATKYTPQDAQEMTKALRKFHPIINGKLLPAIDSALHLVNAWDARMDISAIAGDPDRVFRFRMGALRETAEGLLEFQKMPMPRSQKQERYTRNLNRIAAT